MMPLGGSLSKQEENARMEGNYRKHYGWHALRRSLVHFALGKTFRMATSLTIFVVLVRVLPLNQYAVYVSFHAVIVAVGTITSIGIQKVLFRYLPELRATGNNIAAYRLFFYGMLVRTFVVSLLFVAILPFIPAIAGIFNFDEWVWLFPWYLLMGYLRLTASWLSQCMESFLWQKESQYSLALGGAVTAALVSILALNGNLRLEFVVIAEAAGEATALFFLLTGWLRKWLTDSQRREGDPGWWRKNRSRVLRYGAWSYLLTQSALFYGSAPNRLVAAHFLPVLDVAVLGATDQMMKLVRKLVPTRMFMSMVRPVAMARFAASGDFRAVSKLSEFVFRLNLTLLALPLVVLAVVGPELMDWLTDGKYVAAAYLLMGFLVVLIAEGSRELVALMVQALEKNSIFFWSNLIQCSSLVLALPLLSVLGIWSLVVANFSGIVLANSIVIIRLRRQGYTFSVHFGLIAWIIVHAAVAGAAGWLVWYLTQSIIGTLAVIGTIYGIMIVVKPPLLDREKDVVMDLLRKRLGMKPKARGKPTTLLP
jgi:O-antigen/teichoic acid export membrane protein